MCFNPNAMLQYGNINFIVVFFFASHILYYDRAANSH